MNRTFIQRGVAYGTEDCQLIAKLDNNIVFSGTVSPSFPERPITPQPASPIVGVDIYSWQEPLEFAGTRALEISVTAGNFYVTSTVADKSNPFDPDKFGTFFRRNIDPSHHTFDPLTNVSINGVELNVDQIRESMGLYGQWGWAIPTGHVLLATLNINAGVFYEEYDPSIAYPARTIIKYQNHLYRANPPDGAPAGTPVTDTTHWEQVF